MAADRKPDGNNQRDESQGDDEEDQGQGQQAAQPARAGVSWVWWVIAGIIIALLIWTLAAVYSRTAKLGQFAGTSVIDLASNPSQYLGRGVSVVGVVGGLVTSEAFLLEPTAAQQRSAARASRGTAGGGGGAATRGQAGAAQPAPPYVLVLTAPPAVLPVVIPGQLIEVTGTVVSPDQGTAGGGAAGGAASLPPGTAAATLRATAITNIMQPRPAHGG